MRSPVKNPSLYGVFITPHSVNVSFLMRVPQYLPEVILNLSSKYDGWTLIISKLALGKRSLFVSSIRPVNTAIHDAIMFRNEIQEAFSLWSNRKKKKKKKKLSSLLTSNPWA